MKADLLESPSPTFSIEVASENAFIIAFGDEVSPDISARVHAAANFIKESLSDVLIDIVPSYASILVIFDIWKADYRDVLSCLRQAEAHIEKTQLRQGKLVTLPVYYSVESGPDLESMASKADISIDEVIRHHQQQEYRVYAIGFAPGFAYLGEVDERIATARLPTPRAHVPKGAVGIADRQTAVYPSASPGGWNLIGLCPQDMFNPASEPSMPVQVGDQVRFEPITREQFFRLGGEL